MELGLIYGVLHPNYEESGSLELNLDFSAADIEVDEIGGRSMPTIIFHRLVLTVVLAKSGIANAVYFMRHKSCRTTCCYI